MAAAPGDLPDAMISPETGEALRRGLRAFVVTYKGRSTTVDLPGYYAETGEEGVHVGDDLTATDTALRELKALSK